jgi:hypothetical protein
MKSMFKILTLILMTGFILVGCKKVDTLVRPPLQAHFLFKTDGVYEVASPTTSYTIPVGLTATSNTDRTIEITVTSPTGAVAGTHYSLSKSSLVIPAGKAIESIVVQGVFSQYTSDRKDTLIFTIKETADIKGVSSNSQFTLLVRGACLEEDIVLNEFIGTYTNTNEDFGGQTYGPYETTISAVKQLSATTGEITVTNIYDLNWNPIRYILDWTDINNRTVTLEQQSGIGDAGGVFGPTYNGADLSVRDYSGETGTFSYCSKTIVLKMQVGITNVGWSNSLYQVTLEP